MAYVVYGTVEDGEGQQQYWKVPPESPSKGRSTSQVTSAWLFTVWCVCHCSKGEDLMPMLQGVGCVQEDRPTVVMVSWGPTQLAAFLRCILCVTERTQIRLCLLTQAFMLTTATVRYMCHFEVFLQLVVKIWYLKYSSQTTPSLQLYSIEKMWLTEHLQIDLKWISGMRNASR